MIKNNMRSLRIDSITHEFLRQNFRDRLAKSANQFIIDLIKNSDEFKAYIAKKKAEDKEPKLNFDD